MDIAVIRFPGSNCDDDVFHVVSRVIPGLRARMVWHKDEGLGHATAVIIPGGFSYGDYLRAGAMAAHSPIMSSVKAFADRGGPVLGICNGFQILCESGLLDGALLRNASLRFECRDLHVLVEGQPTPFTASIPAGRVLRLPIAHAEGRYVHPDPEALEREGRVVFRYTDAGGGESPGSNPNGSTRGIAGIANRAGNVVGLMPHPERCSEPILGGRAGDADGRLMFASLAAHLEGRKVRV
jgi:phosphoribosylformylglycinamidine synthase